MCSALSVFGFRIGGWPQNLDYGGGDKSGLGPGSPFSLFAPSCTRKKTILCDVMSDGEGSGYVVVPSTARTVQTENLKRSSDDQKQWHYQLKVIKKAEKTKEGRDNLVYQGECTLTDKTDSCTLNLAFVVTTRTLIHHCVDGAIVVDPIQIL